MTSTSYFSNFPTTTYNGIVIPNIFRRVKFIESLQKRVSIFYPYVIEEGETADVIATWYYGSPEYDWLIYMANNIIDPQAGWPKTSNQFNNFLIDKYGSVEYAQSTIYSYQKVPDIGYLAPDGSDFSPTPITGYNLIVNDIDVEITPSSYDYVTDPDNYIPVYVYDYEYAINETLKNIVLISLEYKDKVVSEFNGLINE
jgi:hypothetical protein